MKDWKLINTVQITEENTKEVYVNTDADGKSFEIEDICILINGKDASTNTGSTGSTIFYRLGDGSIGDRAQYHYQIPVNSANTAHIKYASFVGEKMGDDFVVETNAGTTSNTNTGSTSGFVENGYTIDKIREVKVLLSAAEVYFPVGTVIKIYGK